MSMTLRGRGGAGAIGALCGLLLVGGLTTSAQAVQPLSAGCNATNSHFLFGPPDGLVGLALGLGTFPIHADAFTAGETLTISLSAVANQNVQTVTLRDGSGSITLASLILADGATASAQVPPGFVGLSVVSSGIVAGALTNLVISCSAAPDPVDPSEDVDDVSSNPGQASELVTVQASTLAVTNFASFVNSAVSRRLVAIPGIGGSGATPASRGGSSGLVGADPLAGTAPEESSASVDRRVQVASLLPVGQLFGAATSAIGGGGFAQLAVAGAQLADSALAAADRPLGLWVNGAATFLDNDADGGQYSGHVLSLAGGADYLITDGLLVGLSLGYERGDIDTSFNAGDLVSNGFTAAPYVGWQPIPELVLDASVGVTLLDYEIERAGNTIEGDFDATRGFAAINATGIFRFDRLRLSPLGGVLYFRERQDGYTDSAGTIVDEQTVDLGRLTAGVEAGYGFALSEASTLEPYARVEGEFDFIQADEVTLTTGEKFRPGRYGGSVAGGLNLISGPDLTGNVEASYDGIGRGSYDSVTVQGTLRLAF